MVSSAQISTAIQIAKYIVPGLSILNAPIDNGGMPEMPSLRPKNSSLLNR